MYGLLVVQAELKEKLAKMYDVRDPQQVFVFGFRTQVCSGTRAKLKLTVACSMSTAQLHPDRIITRPVVPAVWWWEVHWLWSYI